MKSNNFNQCPISPPLTHARHNWESRMGGFREKRVSHYVILHEFQPESLWLESSDNKARNVLAFRLLPPCQESNSLIFGFFAHLFPSRIQMLSFSLIIIIVAEFLIAVQLV